VATRILHVSDLHTGTTEDAAVAPALVALVARLEPELVIATGDVTHRNRRAQHEQAAALLRSLGAPLLVVPGNHDIPRMPPGRFTSTFAEFEREWQETEPVHASESFHVVGLNSVRPWRQQSGGLRRSQLRWAAERLREAVPGALRVVALHHHMIGAPWRTRKKPVAERNRVLGARVDDGAVLVSVAPGLGQPRPRRRGEARGLHVYEAAEASVAVSTYIWRDDDWALTAERLFPRGMRPLRAEA
jgi:3',5'-cyclic AMP phosphodiesterase CpdA